MSSRAVVITISDRCSANPGADESGPAIVRKLPALDATLVDREIVPDDVDAIRAAVSRRIDQVELILTTGGTGIAARDVTPEAIAPLLDRALPGFGEAMRMAAFARTPLSIASRGGAGAAGRTLVVWLPGSPRAVAECLDTIAPAVRHVCALLRGEQPH